MIVTKKSKPFVFKLTNFAFLPSFLTFFVHLRFADIYQNFDLYEIHPWVGIVLVIIMQKHAQEVANILPHYYYGEA